MRRFLKRRSQKTGLAPGTVVHIGDVRTEKPRVLVASYGESGLRESEIDAPEMRPPLTPDLAVTWVHVCGVAHAQVLQHIGDGFGLHPLVVEDLANTDQRAKTEDYGDYLFVVAKAAHCDEAAGEVALEQVSIIIGPNFVLSFQESGQDLFPAVRERLRAGKGRLRQSGADYLAYALLDAVVDGYFGALESLGTAIEALEEQLTDTPDTSVLGEIHRLRRETLVLRRAIWPLRDAIAALERDESELISRETDLFLRDCRDHAMRVMDTVSTFGEMLAGFMELHLSAVSNRMNAVMKVLTVIATLFIPLTFIVGVYGMNFKYMPELQWPWGYGAVWLVMLAVSSGMLVYFRRKGWL